MIKEAIYHRPKNSYAYAYDANTLHIRLRSKKDDLTDVELIHGDPYRWAEGHMLSDKLPMAKMTSDELFDYWFIAISPENNRFVYQFEVTDGNETWVMGEMGFTQDLEDNRFFRFPYLNAIDVFDAPAWVKDTVWYQIFPERFANGNPERKTNTNGVWGDVPKPDSFFGGDFEGIIQHLDYLAELGISGIYMTPIFEAPTNHKYDTIDYMKIDPQFGDKETFRQLVKACHERGIRVMLDAVFNHSGYGFAPFQDVLKNGASSRYADWFHMIGFGEEEGDHPAYESFAFTDNMPKLKTSNPEVKEYLLGVAKYWIEEFDIDGWRLDVANEVDHKFWREFRNTVRAAKDDVYIIAEIWNDAMPWLQGDQFDSVMNYPFTEAVIDFIAKGKIGATRFGNLLTSHLQLYPENVSEVMFNLLGSHDTARVLTQCGDDTSKLKLAFLLLFTYPGSPCIYYGDEVGLTGDGDDFAYYRSCMEWDPKKQDQDLLDSVKRLIAIRKSHPALTANSRLQVLKSDDASGLFVFSRSQGDEEIVVALNNGEEPVTVPVPSDWQAKKISDLWTGQGIPSEPGIVDCVLEPKQFRIITINK
ncbi:glycosidase [Fontibacillus phaseoli]|uniref:Glycosidase n=1 Tax=Fontibacillus phaseoli TaxID=1416533 RepID=A0A369B4G1_9BACL|nr:alpha-glycosidase [Fontibacillus phaseoli]RCX16442.1 glycosidase [Fontibacillus phaseoli]